MTRTNRVYDVAYCPRVHDDCWGLLEELVEIIRLCRKVKGIHEDALFYI